MRSADHVINLIDTSAGALTIQFGGGVIQTQGTFPALSPYPLSFVGSGRVSSSGPFQLHVRRWLNLRGRAGFNLQFETDSNVLTPNITLQNATAHLSGSADLQTNWIVTSSGDDSGNSALTNTITTTYVDTSIPFF